MRKKLLSGLLAGVMVFSVAVGLMACKNDYDGTKGLAYELNSDGTYYVTGMGICTAMEIEIGSTYKNVPVTGVGWDAFNDCDSLKSVTIPNSITSIGHRAFFYCSSLRSITIPSSVTSVGFNAFESCIRLIQTEGGVQYVDKWAIGCDKNIGSVELRPDTVGIANGAFEHCYELTCITIPDSVTSIGDCAFDDCSSLTSVTIPNGVTSIGYKAFEDCRKLTSVTIGNSVKHIGFSAFQRCSSLTSITIPDSVTSIESNAFKGCSSLTSIVMPDSVASIDKSAFYECSGIIQTENGVQYIDKWVFDCDKSVTSVELRSDTAGIMSDAFGSCSLLTNITIPNSVKSISESAFANCKNLTSVTIPNGVRSIEDYLFKQCNKLTSVTIPNSVTSIGNLVFWGCPLANIQFEGTKAEWSAIEKNINGYVSTGYTVQCSDGKLDKEGNEIE